ncbi:MAG TPA: hypothetical protein VNF71_04355 [Acidimicrobiales bacterium]|nr:hypothetical protein [Acidimicrobiales bacterium]
MALSDEGSVFPTFAPLRRMGSAHHVTVTPESGAVSADGVSPVEGRADEGRAEGRAESAERRGGPGERRAVSPEQRMRAFHSERIAGTTSVSLDERRIESDRAETEDERSLKVARAEAVEFVVKAFAAVDRNIALADKARLQQEKNQAAAEKLRVEVEKELATAHQLREGADLEMAKARSLAEGVLAAARAEGARIIEEAHARSRAEAESARQRLVESLSPLRDVIGQATGTIDAFVNTPDSGQVREEETIDVRQADDDPAAADDGSAGATLIALPSI